MSDEATKQREAVTQAAMERRYGQQRVSLCQELRGVLEIRGHWVPDDWAGADMITAFALALDIERPLDWVEYESGYAVFLAGMIVARVWTEDYGKTWQWSALDSPTCCAKSHYEGIGECVLRLSTAKIRSHFARLKNFPKEAS